MGSLEMVCNHQLSKTLPQTLPPPRVSFFDILQIVVSRGFREAFAKYLPAHGIRCRIEDEDDLLIDVKESELPLSS